MKLPKRALGTSGLLLSSLLVVQAPQATAQPESLPTVFAERGDGQVSLTPLGSFATGEFDEGASEIVAHHALTQRVFVVNSQAGTVDVLDISDPTNPVKVGSLETPGANSVAVAPFLVAVAEEADETADRGKVSFFNPWFLNKVSEVEVGVLPDMVTFNKWGTKAVVANEGEPEGYCDGQVDPEGSISVINTWNPWNPRVREADFSRFNSRKGQLTERGVRIFGPNSTVAQDLEPEYVAMGSRGRKAYVTLQENNAIAVVDLRKAKVKKIKPLGLKDHSLEGNGLDASDKDDEINIAAWPVKGMY